MKIKINKLSLIYYYCFLSIGLNQYLNRDYLAHLAILLICALIESFLGKSRSLNSGAALEKRLLKCEEAISNVKLMRTFTKEEQ